VRVWALLLLLNSYAADVDDIVRPWEKTRGANKLEGICPNCGASGAKRALEVVANHFFWKQRPRDCASA
jgi:hypothetical protein